MHRPRRQHAFTLAELLLDLALTAMLLAAVAVALHASLESYGENEKSAALTQTVRSILARMMGEVRTAADIDCTENTLTIHQDETGLNRVEYRFNTGTLQYGQTIDGVTNWYPLLDYDDEVSVTDFVVLREETPEGDPVSVTVRLVLAMKDRTFGMTTTAAVRRFQSY